MTGMKKAASMATRAFAPGKPHHAQWLITRKCNYRCAGCNVWKEQDPRELETSEIKKGLDILKKTGIVDLVLSGGEPLLRDDIGEILDYASKSFITTIIDNGSLAAEKIDALRNVDFVAISIDSLDESKNDCMKDAPGSWKKAMEAVELLQNEGINVSVTPTISQKNMYEIVDITKYFTQKGIPVWYCLYSYDISNGEKQLFRIGKADDEYVIKDNQAMIELCNSIIKMKKKNKKILMTNQLLKTVRSFYGEDGRIWQCKALSNFLVVDHLGRIAGCHGHSSAASIFDLPKKWNSQQFKQLRETYSNCTECNYLCYVFYSIQGSPRGYLSLAMDQWRNTKMLFK